MGDHFETYTKHSVSLHEALCEENCFIVPSTYTGILLEPNYFEQREISNSCPLWSVCMEKNLGHTC